MDLNLDLIYGSGPFDVERAYRIGAPHYDSSTGKFACVFDGVRYDWAGEDKLMEFDAVENDIPTTIAIQHNHGRPLLKTAAPFPAAVRAKIASLEYDPKGLWVVNNSLGSMDKWGSNRNGDAFPRLGLINSDPSTYGHKTFEKYAYPYKHHQNKNPKNSIGEKVAFAHWDEDMDKVVLLYKLNREKAGSLAERLDAGEAIPTSMGCFPPGTPVMLRDGRTRPIQDIKVGDQVINGYGKIVTVTETHPRQYRGNLYTVTVATEKPIRVTEEHPFLVLKKEHVKNNHKTPRFLPMDEIDVHKAEWLHASCLKEGDFVLKPVDQEVETPDYVSEAHARLLGYYLAEGHVVRNKQKEAVAVEFTVGVDDVFHEEIEDLCKDFGTKNSPVTRPRRNSTRARSVTVHDRKLAEFCEEHAGNYAKGKYLSESAMRWDPHLQLHVIGAYLNGDGGQNEGWQRGSAYMSTANEQLANQLLFVLSRCGILANVNYIHHKPSEKSVVKIDTFECQIHVGKQYVNALVPYSKVQPYTVEGRGGAVRRLLPNGYILSPIKSVEQSSITYVGPVHNFEVDDGESYVVEGVAVHNCKVPFDVCSAPDCGNKAKTAADYCDHIKYYPGRMDPNGVKYAMINVFPKFFDNSHVLRGADKIAFAFNLESVNCGKEKKAAVFYIPSAWKALETPGYTEFAKTACDDSLFDRISKEASPKMGADKKSAIMKEIPGNLEKVPEERKAAENFIPGAEKDEPGLDTKELTVLLKTCTLSELLGTLAKFGVFLNPMEFQTAAMVSRGDEFGAEKMAALGMCFTSYVPDRPVVLHKTAGCGVHQPRSDEFVTECQHCKTAGMPSQFPPVTEGSPVDYWDSRSPLMTQELLAWMSPDDAGPGDSNYNLTLPEEIMHSMKAEQGPQWKVSHEVERWFRQNKPGFIEKRSAHPDMLYKRMVTKVADLSEILNQIGQDGGDGRTKIIIIQRGEGDGPMSEGSEHKEEPSMLKSMLGSILGLGGGGREHSHQPPPMMPPPSGKTNKDELGDMVMNRVLYSLYRGGMGDMMQSGRGGISLPVKMSSIDPPKAGPFSWAHGLPTQLYAKYAYRLNGKSGVKTAAPTLICDEPWMEYLIAQPALDNTKLAMAMSLMDQDVIDAATLTGLAYVQRVFDSDKTG
jgi:hypothetical protein